MVDDPVAVHFFPFQNPVGQAGAVAKGGVHAQGRADLIGQDGGVEADHAHLAEIAVFGRVSRGEASAIFPTIRNLERLAQFDSIAAARADAASHPIETITPWIAEHDGEPYLFIPEGLGYPVTREPLASVRRGVGENIFPAA